MSKEETVLIKVAYLVELSEETDSADKVLDKILSEAGGDKKVLIDGKDFKLKWESTSSFTLEPSGSNCGRCANCGCWVTDCEKSDRIKELNNGASINGKLLCDECLPVDHRWAF